MVKNIIIGILILFAIFFNEKFNTTSIIFIGGVVQLKLELIIIYFIGKLYSLLLKYLGLKTISDANKK